MNKKLLRTLALVGVTASSLFALQAQASTVDFSNRAAWEAATSGLVNRDFNGYAGNWSHLGTFTDNGVTFSSSNNYVFTVGPSSGNDIGSGNYITGPWDYGNLGAAVLTAGTTSVGTDIAIYAGGGSVSVFVDLLTGTDYSTTVTVPGFGQRSFFGVQATGDSIVSLTFQSLSQDYNVVIDNFATGSNASVPEPATVALLGLGLAGLGFSRRRKQKQAA